MEIDKETYEELLEKQKRRAERFGIELKEVSFPGMVPEHKRYKNTMLEDQDQSLSIPRDESTIEFREKRAERFASEQKHTETWIRETFNLLKEVHKRQNKLPYKGERKLPLMNARLSSDNSVIRPNSIHLYGVDKLSTQDLFQFFILYPPQFIEWLDDSSCNAVFNDEEQANMALESLSHSYEPSYELENEETNIPDNESDSHSNPIDSPKEETTLEEPTDNISDNTEISNETDGTNEGKEENIEIPELNLSLWRVGKLSRKPYTCIFMRRATLEDKRPDFNTRKKIYESKQRRKGNHQKGTPYSRNQSHRSNRKRNNRRNRGPKEELFDKVESSNSTNSERASRFKEGKSSELDTEME